MDMKHTEFFLHCVNSYLQIPFIRNMSYIMSHKKRAYVFSFFSINVLSHVFLYC